MKTLDGRKLSPKTLEEIRIRAVQRVQDGESPEKVIKEKRGHILICELEGVRIS
jgi:hypothetical protein